MIQTNELRIGNYFHPNSAGGGIVMPATLIFYRVGSINKFGDVEVIEHKNERSYQFKYGEYSPVPLTPEILEKCGFEEKTIVNQDCEEREFLIHTSLYDLKWKDDCIEFDFFSLPHIKYLHQLQNLYYSLTGEELEVDLNPNLL